MNFTCIIVDDEYLAIQVIEEYAARLAGLDVKKNFTNPVEALFWLENNTVDLILLDIQMPYMDGITLLKKLEHPPLVIFTTARHDYAIQAFDLDVVDYLLKPVDFDRFKKSIEKANGHRLVKSQKPAAAAGSFLTVKSDYRLNKVELKDIVYIEGLNEYVKIHTLAKPHITLASLKDLIIQLNASSFVRVHKSYIVNTDFIASFSSQHIRLTNDVTVPVGRLYKNEFMEKMK